MKIPKARRLPSGSWYCRVRIGSQDVSITRQTEKEAVAEAMAVKAGIKLARQQEYNKRSSKTVADAIDDYIANRENILSPSTIHGYRAIQRTRFSAVMKTRISDISAAQWQKIVNAEAKQCSAKTLKNAWGLLSSVISEETEHSVSVRLPQVVEKDGAFLTPEQIPIFVEAIKGKTFEIPALLALSSLRRSEILALHWEDISLERDIIHIRGAAVIGEGNQLVRKEENKNRSSRRTIPIIPPLRTALMLQSRKSGLVVTTSPTTLYSQINKLCRALHLPEVGVHGLRRSFASLAYHLGLSEEMTMRIGGWSNIYTMRRIYTKLSEQDIAEQSSQFKSFFDPQKGKNGNENGDKKE